MSLHEQSHPQEAPGNLNAETGEAIGLHIIFRVAARIVAVLFALSLLPLWLYLCSITELGLDYPIRRAGESDLYPARGTLAFWWICFIHISKDSLLSYVFGGIPIIGAICVSLYYGFSIRTWTARIIIALFIASGPFIWGYLHILFYDSWPNVDAVWQSLGKFLQR
ncbi:hypothetical protein [Roseimicrobium sp. ORNL1]|uniref:hypothetical protein n=1 Tax=Roseimicrobium sp. ORNL1 TaxID=2711231 RepID=UPI0013E1B575|nr:hypothetical protein [Roseimicrobium sp. ORNL1]QIF02767.1 hypothetical protein G5S37_14975 [Roseimicrobium sp. ORNL1]